MSWKTLISIFVWTRDATAYVFPFTTPTTRMDSQSAKGVLTTLRVQDAGKLKTALSALSLLRHDDTPVLTGAMSIEGLAQVMSGLWCLFQVVR